MILFRKKTTTSATLGRKPTRMTPDHGISVVFSCFLLWSAPLIEAESGLGSSSKVSSRHFKWEVGYMFWSPDCLENVVIGINGHFPGPTIRAKAGDTIVVELTNKLHTEGVVIHWHGIRQGVILQIGCGVLFLFDKILTYIAFTVLYSDCKKSHREKLELEGESGYSLVPSTTHVDAYIPRICL
ncbi:hypothetical protein ACLOJK_014672 [Asimina triloba]